MKKFLLLALATGIAFPAASYAQGTLKIGTIDMQRAFKEYNKTKDAEAKVNDAKNAAKKEFDDRTESYKKALDEINTMNEVQLTLQDLTNGYIVRSWNGAIDPPHPAD